MRKTNYLTVNKEKLEKKKEKKRASLPCKGHNYHARQPH